MFLKMQLEIELVIITMILFMRLLKVEEMKNKEKYAKEIVEIACSGHSIAIIKESGNIVSCGDIKCNLSIIYPSIYPRCTSLKVLVKSQ